MTIATRNRHVAALIGHIGAAKLALVRDDEFKTFMEQITLRHERATNQTERWLRIADKRTDDMVQRTDQMARRTDEMVRRTDDMIRRTDLLIEESRDFREEMREFREEFKEESRAGVTSINNSTTGAETHMPLGGNGWSGNGSREGGVWALDAYSRWQAVNVDLSGKLQRAQMDVEPGGSIDPPDWSTLT